MIKQQRNRSSEVFLIFCTLVFLGACTDKRTPPRKEAVEIHRAPAQVLSPVNDVRINGKDITAFQMTGKAGSLYITGTPFGFTKWDITANPESPRPTFVAGDDIGKFTYKPDIFWRPDYYGSGALGIVGNFAILSGVLGASFINMSSTEHPHEVARYPMIDENQPEVIPQDDRFVYKAISFHPKQPIAYGMREQDYMTVLNYTSGGLSISGKIPYGTGNVCCVLASAVFNGKLFTAFGGMLRVHEMAENGSLSAQQDITKIQAVNVVATDKYLYVQHQASYSHSEGAGLPSGVYVFNAAGSSVAFLPIQPKTFAVSANDSHLYANEDDTAVRIYRILWTNQ